MEQEILRDGIKGAYRMLGGGKDKMFVQLSEIREMLPGAGRQELDAALTAM